MHRLIIAIGQCPVSSHNNADSHRVSKNSKLPSNKYIKAIHDLLSSWLLKPQAGNVERQLSVDKQAAWGCRRSPGQTNN